MSKIACGQPEFGNPPFKCLCPCFIYLSSTLGMGESSYRDKTTLNVFKNDWIMFQKLKTELMQTIGYVWETVE